MRIARIRHLFYPDMPRDYFYELSTQQVKQGNEVHVLTWNKNKSMSELACDGFSIHRLSGLNFRVNGSVQDYPYLPALSSHLSNLSPDIIHAESHLFLPSVQALRIAKRIGCPFVVSVHGVYANRGFAINAAQKSYLHIISSFFKGANRIICLTKDDAAEIVKYGFSPEKIRIVPNAVDTERFKPASMRESNLVVWVGRFVPEKGLEYLIEAAKLIHDKGIDVKFLLIGYGPLKSRIVNMAYNRGLLGRSVFISKSLAREEIAAVLGKATIFAFPSIKEGLPISVLEATACGVPIVASDISGIREVIENGKSGILVAPKDASALASSIVGLLNDEAYRFELGSNARQWAIRKYDWKNVLSKLQSVYLEAINDSNDGYFG